jgi:MYXO-CTERM domain-containing protein
MLRFARHLVGVFVLLVVAGCTGGGCSAGCSCAGVTPLAEGYPPENRIENVASVRITDSGFDFIEQNLGGLAANVLGQGMGGILTFEVPPSSQDLIIANADICPNGPMPNANPPECVAEIDLGNAQLVIDPEAPHNIHVHGPMPVRIQKLPLKVTWFGFLEDNLDMVLNANKACPGAGQPFQPIDIDVQVSIEIDPDVTHSRMGYSRVRIEAFGVDTDDLLNGIEYCDQNGVTGAILDALDDFFIGLLADQIIGTLQSSLEDQLCQQANPDLTPPCPTGTTNDNGVCRYADGSCASIILGMDGHIDLGGLLAGFSPGTKGAFDFLFAAGGHSVRDDGSGFHWGDLNPIANGGTLGLYGGTTPVPVSGCVTPVHVDLPTGIPIPDELLLNTVPDWPMATPGPHVGLALSERFTNYMMAQLYNSGALCLGITAGALGNAIPLGTGLVSVPLGTPSMLELGRQKQSAEIAIILRPAQPPTVEFGNGTDIETDPSIRVKLPQVSFDFYVFSLDRYIRMLTATMDLDIPINLMVGPDGLSPLIEKLGVSNASVTNSQLIREEPEKIAAALEELLGSLVGSFLGDALPAIDINGPLAGLGLQLTIPETVDGQGSPGLRKLTKGTDDFLGIFATLGIAAPMMAPQPGPPQSDTDAELADLWVDTRGLHWETWEPGLGPRASIRVGSALDDGTRAIEWQYKVDAGPWHPFVRRHRIEVEDATLRVQGNHTVFVRSRVVGDPWSLDRTPEEVVVRIDDTPPEVRVTEDQDGQALVQIADNVSSPHTTEVRVRFGSEVLGVLTWDDWSAWMPSNELPPLWQEGATYLDVEARDEAGHIGTATQELIRGRADGSGCNCRMSSERRAGGAWLLLAGLALAGFRRRRKVPARKSLAHVGLALGVVLLGGLSGCSCGEDAESGAVTGCRARGDCKLIEPGLIGAYTSVALAPDGTTWVAGYLEANWDADMSFGDLVVGRFDGTDIAWRTVDGVPAEPPVDENVYDPTGFRGGQTEAGDDVGLWTSIAVDPSGSPAVAYYDSSFHALRYASSAGGDAWEVATVQKVDQADLGRYAKLDFVGGVPTIAYLFIEPGEAGAVKSGVRLAHGSGAGAAAATWTFEDVFVNPATPCKDINCKSFEACVVSDGLCHEKSADCTDDCGQDACVLVDGAPVCEAGPGGLESYPDASGLYIGTDLHPDGALRIAFYDRVRGNVMVAAPGGGGWVTQIVDGEDAMGVDTGDKGIGLGFDVDDSGNYHLAYVDGLDESVDYLFVAMGTQPAAPEVVDDGLGGGDGVHLVGDDADVVLTQNGDVQVSYQDATSGQLRYAVGAPQGQTHAWTVKVIEQEGFAGAFSELVDIGGQRQVLNWWRVASPVTEGNARFVVP